MLTAAGPLQPLSPAGSERSGATLAMKDGCLSLGLPCPQQSDAAEGRSLHSAPTGSLSLAAKAAERLAVLRTANALLAALQTLPPAQMAHALAALGPLLAAAWPQPGTPSPRAKAAAPARPGALQRRNLALFAAGLHSVQAEMPASELDELKSARAFLASFPA
ncbi:hypothetical protein ABPG75_005835 [Micractinium tetrahymenae]